jgi:tRNA U34 5-methylaminomethyl-2-thiouridine-forming methyltransferase MnmC
VQNRYSLVRLRNETYSVRSLADEETFHPGIGPIAEAEALYVRQLRLPERVAETKGEFVLWDVGLGAAANALTAFKQIQEVLAEPKSIRLVSFDQTSDAAAFALQHSNELGYLAGYQDALAGLIQNRFAKFDAGLLNIEWSLVLDDFPQLLKRNTEHPTRSTSPAPHAIMFDPHSPQKNPAMWTVSLFENLFRALDPNRPCSLATFTRSTLARTAVLLGGFFVGIGHPSGMKEETSVAANRIELLDEPLDRRWLDRAMRSDSAEPLRETVYHRARLSSETWDLLREHPQFR